MYKARWTTLAALGALAMACSAPAAEKMEMGPTAADVAAARTAIEAVNAAGTAAIMAGDAATFAANYSDDAILMMSNSPAWKGRAAIAAGLKEMMAAMTFSNPKFSSEDVMLAGDLAIETGAYEWTVTPKGGKPMADKGKYLTTWKKQADGSWKMLRDISNTNLPMTN